jgi:hypothetical protein
MSTQGFEFYYSNTQKEDNCGCGDPKAVTIIIVTTTMIIVTTTSICIVDMYRMSKQ